MFLPCGLTWYLNMTRCSNYLTCTVVGFNFGYVTLAIGIIGISFVRRITADPIKYSLHLLNVVTGQKDEWEYPFQVYMYASFIPVGCSIVGLLLAFAWVALVRPAVYPSWRTNILCKESTSVLFVIMMMAYTGALFPGPIKGLKYSEIVSALWPLDRIWEFWVIHPHLLPPSLRLIGLSSHFDLGKIKYLVISPGLATEHLTCFKSLNFVVYTRIMPSNQDTLHPSMLETRPSWYWNYQSYLHSYRYLAI